MTRSQDLASRCASAAFLHLKQASAIYLQVDNLGSSAGAQVRSNRRCALQCSAFVLTLLSMCCRAYHRRWGEGAVEGDVLRGQNGRGIDVWRGGVTGTAGAIGVPGRPICGVSFAPSPKLPAVAGAVWRRELDGVPGRVQRLFVFRRPLFFGAIDSAPSRRRAGPVRVPVPRRLRPVSLSASCFFLFSR